MIRTPFKRGTSSLKRSPFRKSSKSPVALCKIRIQALLRQAAINRDGGCVLRHYEEAGACGGYKKDGELILQAEHLVTRGNSISFGDMRNIVCLCRNHHGFWKPQFSRLYWELVERHIGKERWEWIKRVEADRRPHPMCLYDWEKIELALTQELSTY